MDESRSFSRDNEITIFIMRYTGGEIVKSGDRQRREVTCHIEEESYLR